MNLLEEGEDMGGDGDENEKPKVTFGFFCLLMHSIFSHNSFIQKRKHRKDALMNRKNRLDPNAPQFNRIPLPEMYFIF